MHKIFGMKIQIFSFILALITASIACNTPDVSDAIVEEVVEKCFTVSRSEYERQAAGLGQTPETPKYPDSAVYEVCYRDWERTENPRATSIRMTDGDPPEDDDANVVTKEKVIEVCKLLPVDESLVTIPANEACVAEFDALVGCGECESVLSITRMESAEKAQQAAIDGKCGNPKFSARGESPIGASGFTCTNTSGDEYRPGVAQSYFYLSFSNMNYVVAIHTGYPGMEDLVIDLGQETINRIDNSLDQ